MQELGEIYQLSGIGIGLIGSVSSLIGKGRLAAFMGMGMVTKTLFDTWRISQDFSPESLSALSADIIGMLGLYLSIKKTDEVSNQNQFD